MEQASYSLSLKTLSGAGLFEGVASDFQTVDAYGEIVAPGAFTDSLERHKAQGTSPVMLLHHDSSRPVGNWTQLHEREDGLHVEGKLLMDVRDGAEAYSLLKARALTGLSIGYRVEEKSEGADGVTVLEKVDLVEVSLVSFPANPNARVTTVKSICNAGDIADLLRDAGLSGRKAKLAAGAAWKAIHEKENEGAASAELVAILEASAARIAAIGG
jgi:HK97 family phage prohead protease